MSLLVLSEEERAELEDCFVALAGAPTGVIGIKHITKAMELVLGPEHSSEKEAKAALDAMGPNISGNVDKAAFRAYMINNWALPAAPTATEVVGRRRSAQGFDVGAMRPSDMVRMYRRQTLGERTLKKAQEQVQMMMHHGRAGPGDGGAKAAAAGLGSGKDAAGSDPWSFQDRRRSCDLGPRPPMEPGGSPSARRNSKRSFDSAVETQRAGGARAPGGQAAVVPLSRFRRASMLLLEAALASEKQSSQMGSMSSMASMGSMEPEGEAGTEQGLKPEAELNSDPENHSPNGSIHEDQTVHEKPADDAAQLAWEQHVLSLCCLDSAQGPREDWADLVPVQQLLLSPQAPGTPQQPRGPREASSASSSEPQAVVEHASTAPQLSSFSAEQVSDAGGCEPAAVKAGTVKAGFIITSESSVGSGCSKHRHYSVQFSGCSAQPPDVAQSLRALGQQNSLVRGSWQQDSPSALPFDAFSSECSGSSYDSNGESDEDSEACEVAPPGCAPGSTGGVTSWVAKRLTRFASRDEQARTDEPQLVPRGASASLLSTLGMRRSSVCLTVPRCASEQLGALPPPLRAGEQCTMPQPGGAGVESMLRRVGCSQRGLLPSVCQGSQSGQAGLASFSALGSRAGMQVPAHMAVPVVARSSFLGVPRTDKAIVDLHAKIAQKSRRHERWNLA